MVWARGSLPHIPKPAGVVVNPCIHDGCDLAGAVEAMVPQGSPAHRVRLDNPPGRVVQRASFALLLDPPDIPQVRDGPKLLFAHVDHEAEKETVIRSFQDFSAQI